MLSFLEKANTAKENSFEALVISVGKGKGPKDGTIQPIEVKAGDKVLIGKYVGDRVKLDGTEYIILRKDEILGIFDE